MKSLCTSFSIRKLIFRKIWAKKIKTIKTRNNREQQNHRSPLRAKSCEKHPCWGRIIECRSPRRETYLESNKLTQIIVDSGMILKKSVTKS